MVAWIKGALGLNGNIKDKKEWILNNLPSAKNGKINELIKLYRECNLQAKLEIVKESAFLPITPGLTSLMTYILQNGDDEIVKKHAKNVVDSRHQLKFSVLQNWNQIF